MTSKKEIFPIQGFLITHKQLDLGIKMWKNIGQYTYIRAMTCQGTHLIIYLVFFRGPERQEIPKHLTNFNHCMMTINSRGLAGGRGGGVFRTAVGILFIFFQNNFILVSMTGFLHAFTCIIMYQPTIFISNLIQNISECESELGHGRSSRPYLKQQPIKQQ